MILEKEKYNTTEKKIMRLLYQTKTPMTTYEIAKELGISFKTDKKYLEELVKKGVILDKDG